MHKLIEYICDELEELERKADKEGKLSMAEIQYGDMLAHFKKNLLKGEEMYGEEEEMYSMAGGSYEGGRSYARGGNRGGGNRGGGQSRRGGMPMYGGNSYRYEGEGSYARGRGRDRGYYDYYDGDYLEDEDLMEWSKKLMKEVEENDKQFFSKENIERKAEEMGIKFDKFSFPEFYTTALMMYTDYHTTIGSSNMEVYLKLAKDWLCDEDAELQYGEKLSAYYESIVEGE